MKRTGRKTLSLLLALCMVLSLLPVFAAAEGEVNTFVGLKTALQSGVAITLGGDITITEALTIPDGVTINGGGYTLSAEKTGVSEAGIVQSDGSTYVLLTVASGSTVTLKNMTVMGGSKTGISNEGTLTMENVTVTRTGYGETNHYPKDGGGGIKNTNGKLILKNCSIVRNVSDFGGGIVNDGGKVVMDGCSLSENRSLNTYGGGGAAENKNGAFMYINNSVISNNTSSEIGGAINNYKSTLYLMNSTVTGNATTYSEKAGGGIGNNRGKIYAVNSIISDNYYYEKNDEDPAKDTVTPSDIGNYNSLSSTNDLYYCACGTIQGTANITDLAHNITDVTNIFAGYADNSITNADGTSYQTLFSHPILTRVSAADSRLYAPLKAGHGTVTGGAAETFFDYSDLSAVKMSYKAMSDGAETALGGLAAGEDKDKVTTYIEGGVRAANVMGASGVSDKTYYSVRLLPPSGGTVSGATIYGDGYPEGTQIHLIAAAGEDNAFDCWLDSGNVISNTADWSPRVNHNMLLTSVFHSGSYSYTLTAPEPVTANGLTATVSFSQAGADADDTVTATVTLTGTPLATGTQTFSLGGSGLTLTPVTAASGVRQVAAGEALQPDMLLPSDRVSYTFTMPNGDVDAGSFVLTNTFTAAPIAPITPAAPAAPTDAPVAAAGKVTTTTNADGTKNTTVTVDSGSLEKQIEAAGTGSSAVVTVPAATGTASAQLVVRDVENLSAKNMSLEIKTGDTTYTVAPNAIDTAKVASELGATDTSKVPLTVTVTPVKQSDVTVSKGEQVSDPVKFEITASYNGKTVSVSSFNSYVSRTLSVPAGVGQNKITTGIRVEDGEQVPTFVSKNADGAYTAKISSLTNSTYVIIYNEASFADTAGKWYNDIVTEMASRTIVNGKSANTFDGDGYITRAEYAAILVRALGIPESGTSSFSDVAGSDWYYGAVSAAVKYGVILGYEDGTFRPNANITREEAMAMLQRAAEVAEYAGTAGTLTSFTDAGRVSAWARTSAAFSVGSGLIVGNGGLIRPEDNITRAESAAVVLRLLQKSGLVDVRSKT